MTRSAKLGRSILAAGLLCGAAAVTGCNNPANGQAPPPPLAALPPTTAAGPALTTAPAADQLPAAPAPPLQRVAWPGDSYAFADRAYAMDVAFADSPPDYDFYDDAATPWVWVANDGSECIAELTPYGWRYYYYDPGVDEPFFIEDPEYGYGFEGGALVVVYDHFGREYPAARMLDQDRIAGAFLTRATQLRQAGARDPHRAVTAADWSANRDVIAGPRQAWARAAASNPAWSAYRSQHAAQDQAHWNGERLRREAWAARVDASLGEPRRAAAEWQTAAAQASRSGDASSWRSAAWTGWRGAPPPVRGTAGPAERAPEHGLASASPPPLLSGGPEGRFRPQFSTQGPAARGAPGYAPTPHGGETAGATPSRLTERAQPPAGFEGAPSAVAFGAPASARIPERAAAPHFATPAAHVMERATPSPHAFAASHFVAPPPHVAPPAHFAAPHFAAPAVPHLAPAAHAPPPVPPHPANNHGGNSHQR